MQSFSERYGYVRPSDIIILEDMPESVQNAICTRLDELGEILSENAFDTGHSYEDLEVEIWCKFLNKRRDDVYEGGGTKEVATALILDSQVPWFRKIDVLEFILHYLNSNLPHYNNVCHFFIRDLAKRLNEDFERLNYGYRIVNDILSPITSKAELQTIEDAMNISDSVTTHLNKAMVLYSQRPFADYRNSIKESISAVEAICRAITGCSTLGNALNELENKGVPIQSHLKKAFGELYYYTNDKDTGIRHALLDDKYEPTDAEAYYMLISCSAFVNYINKVNKD